MAHIFRFPIVYQSTSDHEENHLGGRVSAKSLTEHTSEMGGSPDIFRLPPHRRKLPHRPGSVSPQKMVPSAAFTPVDPWRKSQPNKDTPPSLHREVGRQRVDEVNVPLFVAGQHSDSTLEDDDPIHPRDDGENPLDVKLALNQHSTLDIRSSDITVRDQEDNPSMKTNEDDDDRSSHGKPAKKPASKILFLDGMRGLAVLLVVLHHSEFTRFLNSGAWGVDIFFVLSSFLLTMIFDKKARQLVQTSASLWKWFISLIDYFQRRFLRVYPFFALVAISLTFLDKEQQHRYYTIGDSPSYDLWRVLKFTRRYRYFLFWTLPVEIGYYFVIPVFVLAMMTLGKRWWIPVIPVYVWVFYTTAYGFRESMMGLSEHIQTFVAGSMSAIVYLRLEEIMKRRDFEFSRWHRIALRVVEYITFAYLLSTCFKGLLFRWLFANPFPENKGDRFTSLHICIIIVIEMLSPSEFSKCLEWNVLRAWGKISFSVYLLHPFVIFDNWVFKQPNIDRFCIQMALCFMVATVSYHFIEVPLQKVAGKISRFLASKTSHDRPYQEAPKLSVHLPVLRTKHEKT